MEKFGENFCGGKDHVMCLLYGNHLDNQELSFQCQVVREKLNVSGEISTIYKEKINMEIISAISQISKYKNEILENKK